MGPDLDGHATCNFRHRRQQRQPAAPVGNRFVGDACNFALQELLCQFAIRREVQVGEEQLAFAHAGIFGRNRLLDLHDHVSLGPDVVSGVDDLRTRFLIEGIVETGTFARAFLNDDPVAGVSQCANARGS